MALPLYLALTREEMAASPPLPAAWGWMMCPFSPAEQLPENLPPGTMLILNDRFSCRGHDPIRVAEELADAVETIKCESVLLDFEREPDEKAILVAKALLRALPCPMAAPPGFTADLTCAVFLPPCPLHVPLAEYLRPWQGRDIWLDTTLQCETITVTRDGTTYSSAAPSDRQDGVFDDVLKCRCVTETAENEVRFTLFDTPETLKIKLDEAVGPGVSRAVGLYQELNGKL